MSLGTFTPGELRTRNVTLGEAITIMEAHHLDPEFIEVDAAGKLVYWATAENPLADTVAYPAEDRGKFPGGQILDYLGY